MDVAVVDQVRSTLLEVLPRELTQKIRARRRCSSFREAGIAMVHVPRTAGDSITNAVYGRFLGHFTLQDFLAVAPNDVLRLPRFTVVRNPWSRLVSAWCFARAGGGSPKPDGTRVRISRPEYYQQPKFADFTRFVNEWLVPHDIRKADWIFQPQVDFVCDSDGELAFDHIGRFENLDPTSTWLSAKLMRSINLRHTNRSSQADYRNFYTPNTRDLVGHVYASDVAHLGYDF